MATYLVGDIQGCLDPLQRLLDRIRFDPARDRLWCCGDLVHRGGASLQVLRLLHNLPRVKVTLGNHDLWLLAQAARHPEGGARSREINEILTAKDRDSLLFWLRRQKLAHYSKKFNLLRVHAGVVPQWGHEETLKYAGEIEKLLRGKKRNAFLSRLRGSSPKQWKDSRDGWGRYRLICNILTRIRFCTAEGKLNGGSGPPGSAPKGYRPWFAHENRKTLGVNIAFGHWAALGLHLSDGLIGLDSGCVWGGRLSAFRLEDRALFQAPGAPAWSAAIR